MQKKEFGFINDRLTLIKAKREFYIEFDLGNAIGKKKYIIEESHQYRFEAKVKKREVSYNNYFEAKKRLKRRQEGKYKQPPAIKVFNGGLISPK